MRLVKRLPFRLARFKDVEQDLRPVFGKLRVAAVHRRQKAGHEQHLLDVVIPDHRDVPRGGDAALFQGGDDEERDHIVEAKDAVRAQRQDAKK